MRAAIFGAGDAGRFLYDELSENSKDIEIIGFLDNFLEGHYRGKQIYNPKNFLKYRGG